MKLNDKQIRKLCLENDLIYPFTERVSGNGIISYGLSSSGYDCRLAPEFKLIKPTFCEILDPKKFRDVSYCDRVFDTVEAHDHFLLAPHSYVLARTVEYIRMPRNLDSVILGKSTWARCGLIVNTTPAEPGWEGFLTLELANASHLPIKLYVNEGICQFQFYRIDDPDVSYADRDGVYQAQKEVTPARIK